MREYGKVIPRFWTGGSGAALRGDPLAQLAAVYLFTCPSANPIGIFYLPLVTMAHEIGCSVAEASAALARLAGAGIIRHDPAESLVWVPEMARVSLGDRLSGGDKRRGWILKELGQHRRHPFARLFIERYGASYGITAPLEAPSKPLGSPIEGASGSIEMEQGAGAGAGAVARAVARAPFGEPPATAPPPVAGPAQTPGSARAVDGGEPEGGDLFAVATALHAEGNSLGTSALERFAKCWKLTPGQNAALVKIRDERAAKGRPIATGPPAPGKTAGELVADVERADRERDERARQELASLPARHPRGVRSSG